MKPFPSSLRELMNTLTCLGQLFFLFFKIGAFTFGGGYVMLPIIEREIVEKREWIERDKFLDILALAQSVPGALAVNTSFQVGYRLYGIKGALTAVLGAALPSFIIILLIALYFFEYRNHPLAEYAFMGILPAVAALITAATWRMGEKTLGDWKGLVICGFLLFPGYFLDWNPFFLLLAGALGGIFMYHREEAEAGSDE